MGAVFDAGRRHGGADCPVHSGDVSSQITQDADIRDAIRVHLVGVDRQCHVVLWNKRPGLGVDLRGGTILVYEIDPSKNHQVDGESGPRIVSEDLIEPLIRRINPSGTQEIVIRPYGESQIEIIVPEVDQREVDRIKELVEEAGILRFAIVANRSDHQRIIDLAIEQSQSSHAGRTNARRGLRRRRP